MNAIHNGCIMTGGPTSPTDESSEFERTVPRLRLSSVMHYMQPLQPDKRRIDAELLKTAGADFLTKSPYILAPSERLSLVSRASNLFQIYVLLSGRN